jgi:hypothetical protein
MPTALGWRQSGAEAGTISEPMIILPGPDRTPVPFRSLCKCQHDAHCALHERRKSEKRPVHHKSGVKNGEDKANHSSGTREGAPPGKANIGRTTPVSAKEEKAKTGTGVPSRSDIDEFEEVLLLSPCGRRMRGEPRDRDGLVIPKIYKRLNAARADWRNFIAAADARASAATYDNDFRRWPVLLRFLDEDYLPRFRRDRKAAERRARQTPLPLIDERDAMMERGRQRFEALSPVERDAKRREHAPDRPRDLNLDDWVCLNLGETS